jgi:hypothetical protein
MEEFFIKIFSGLSSSKPNSCGDVLYTNSDGSLVYVYNMYEDDITYSYIGVYSLFEKEFGIPYNDIRDFISSMEEKYLNVDKFNFNE